jgi:hypothetical protein
LEVTLAALARAFSQAFPANSLAFETVKQVPLFCAAGLFVSLLLMPWGLDLSARFF